MKSQCDRILVLAPIPPTTLDRLRDRFDLIEAWQDPLAFLTHAGEAGTIEIVFTIGNRPLSREMIDRLPSLRYVCHYGVGHDRIDLAALRERDILITNTTGGNSSCVADLAMAMLTACVRRLFAGDRFVRDGRWEKSGTPYGLTAHLGGRKVGLYGLGDIGTKIALRASAFEMVVGYHTRQPRSDVPARYFSSLLALAEWADDLIVAVKATHETAKSVDAAVLRALGPKGYLVNVARGSVVGEDALVAAIRSGMIAGAALDTFENEPAIRSEFASLENVILSPHAGGGTFRAMQDTDEVFLANLGRYLAGQEPQNIVG